MWREARCRGDRGAITLLTVLIVSVLFAAAAIVVDIGMQRVTRRDLQALADVVALDLAREITGGRTQADLAPAGDFTNPASAVSRSVARNDDVLGIDLDVDVDWGSWDGTVWNTATDPPSAVQVTARAETDYALTSGTGSAVRRAYAVASNSACYRLGTFVAAVKSGDSTVLGPAQPPDGRQPDPGRLPRTCRCPRDARRARGGQQHRVALAAADRHM